MLTLIAGREEVSSNKEGISLFYSSIWL